MTVRVRVKNNKQIIVPVRFARAVTGAPVLDAPDLDDHGFEMGNRPGSWGSSDARGAMVGIQEGDTVRLRVLLEDIDAAAPLYVTSTDTAVADIVAPVGGGPLPANGIFQVRGVKDFRNRPVKIQVHLGAADGPVIGEMEPHIYKLRSTLRVLVHLVSINGVATARTAASLGPIFDVVNTIWRPAGIQFQNPPSTRVTNVNGFTTAGQVTTHLNATPASWTEFSQLINTGFSSTRINIYCVQGANEWRGLTFDNDVARNPNHGGYGIALVDGADANDFAHELGHFLNIDEHTDDLGGHNFRFDSWARRSLMFRFNPYRDVTTVAPPQPAHRNNVGYGNLTRGALITVKNLPGDNRDGELATARRRSRNPY